MSSTIVGLPQNIQPRENAFYSMDNAVHNLEKVIGRLPDTVRNDYINEQTRTHGDLTELLLSKVPPVVTQTVTGLLLKTYVSPFTSILLPIRQLGPYESLNVQWQEIHFDDGLAPQVEVEGLARLYGHKKTKRGAMAVRRGVAVKQESGFYMSPEGRSLWVEQIQQLATIVQRTNDYDVMITLLQTPLRDSRHANNLGGPTNVYGSKHSMTIEERLKLEVDWFGIVNKAEDSRGFANLLTSLRTAMKKQGVEPDAMVVPPNMVGYYMGNNPDLWEYSSAGPSNQSNRKASEDIGNENGIRTQTFQGMKLIDTNVTRMADGDSESPSDLLTVPKQIGEYYPMLTSNSFIDSNSFMNYQSRFRSIKIFNEDHGRFVPVKFSDCVINSFRWDEQGELSEDSHRDDRVNNDLFMYGNKQIAYKWIDMAKENLSEESVDNVIASVIGKFGPNVIADVNETINKMQVYSDIDVKPPIQTQQGTIKYTDQKAAYVEERKNLLSSLWNDVHNNFLSKIVSALGGEKSGDVIKILTRGYVTLFQFEGTKNERNVQWVLQKNEDDANVSRRKEWEQYLNKKSAAERIVGHAFLISRINRENMTGLDRKDIYVPVDFVLCRPWMTYSVSSAIVMKSGTDTGETVIGDQKFEMTSNISDRTLYGNYFYYGKAIVKKDRNIIVAPSVFIQNYIKGNNTTFVTNKQIPTINDESGLLEDSRSIVALMTRVNDPVVDSNIIDIRGNRPGLSPPNDKPSFYATADYYNAIFNIDSAGLDDPMTHWQDYEDINIRANSICFLGHTETSTGEVIYKNTGHLGQNTYDGVQMSRRPGYYSAVRNMHK